MKSVYKNSALNIGAQILIMIVMLLAMPFIIRGLGEISFAILSLVWTVITYFTLWDLGIGRAVTKFVAELSRSGKKEDVAPVVFQSGVISLLIGGVLGVLLFAFEDKLVASLFKVPESFHASIVLSLRFVAYSMPVLVLQGALRGALMGYSRFDLTNLLQVTNGILQWGGSLLLVLLKFDVVWIIGFVLLSRVLTTALHLVFVINIVGFDIRGNKWRRAPTRKMLGYGGWAMISQIVSPVLQYAERFILSGTIATSIVAFYVVPYEATSKLLVLSVGMVSALFPAMSGIHRTTGLNAEFNKLYNQSERLLLFVFLPIGTVLICFAPEILRIWIGSDFAAHGAVVFQILSLAFVFCAISQLPFTILQAVGRSDLTGTYHLIELPVYIGLAYVLIKEFGLIGAGLATLIRTASDVLFLYAVTSRSLGLKVGLLKDPWRTLVFPLGCLLLAVLPALLFSQNSLVKILSMGISLGAYAVVIFRYAMSDDEKSMLRKMVFRLVNV
jgi:O-antigen/teichoic acid export membrane protein